MPSIFKSTDWLLFILVFLLVLFGVLILISLTSFRFPQQLIHLLFAFFVFFLFAAIDYRAFRHFTIPFYFLAFLLLTLTFIFGKTTKGAIRWLNLGLVSFQASELIKPILILIFSDLSLKLNLKKISGTLFFFLLFLPFLVLIFKQPDLGNTIIYLTVFLSIFYLAGGRLLFLFSGFILSVGIFPFIWQFLQEYQKQRLLSFFQPTTDPLGVGYNLIQALVTVGSGRFSGRGLGIGTQSTLRFLPERTTDFIFASLAEEVGFFGCLFFLLILFLLLLRIYLIGEKTKDNFGRIVAFSSFSLLFFQSSINIGMNLGLLPITGITLPLISQGGSSLIATMITLGIVSNIATRKKSYAEK